MLELNDISVTLGEFTLQADLSVPLASRMAVIGASGSGKSTLLSLIGGFLTPDRGKIHWDGQDITDLPPGQRPVSFLFQDQNLFPHLTIAQNVGLGLRPDLRLNADQKARVSRALSEVGLSDMEKRFPASLSGGQQGRVALARILLRARPLLLLDEPFAALGPALKVDMLELVMRIASETSATVLMVTHDPEDARRFAPQTILIEDGSARAPTPTGALLDNPPSGLRAYLG